MMKIQIFSEYTKIAEAGRAKALTCPMHEDDIFLLTPNLNNEDQVVLQCFACGYKNIAGYQLYENIKKVVERESTSK